MRTLEKIFRKLDSELNESHRSKKIIDWSSKVTSYEIAVMEQAILTCKNIIYLYLSKGKEQRKLNIKKVRENAHIPTRADEGAAGYDLYAATDGDIVIEPGKTAMIPSGYAFEIPAGYFGGVFPRSGLSTKHGIRLANCVAVIDSSYRGEVQIPLHNDLDEAYTIHTGDRVAQMVIIPYFAEDLNETDELSDTTRGQGGFGSSGR